MTESDRSDLDDSGQILNALSSVQDQLARRGGPSDFSSDAVAALLSRQLTFVEDLALQSLMVAKWRDNDEVQSRDVETAADIVTSGTGNAEGALQALAGALIGLAGTLFVSELLAKDPHIWLLFASVLVLVISAVLLTVTVTPGVRARVKFKRR